MPCPRWSRGCCKARHGRVQSAGPSSRPQNADVPPHAVAEGRRAASSEVKNRGWADVALVRYGCAGSHGVDVLINICVTCRRSFSRRARPVSGASVTGHRLQPVHGSAAAEEPSCGTDCHSDMKHVRSPNSRHTELVVMAPGGQGARPGPGMPGALGRPPGWRRRGCRRPPRTGRTARSRRSATRPPHQAGPVRSRHEGCCGQHRVLELRVFPAAEGALGQEPLAQSLQGQRVSPAGPAPVQRVRRDADEHLAGEGVVPRVQGRKLAHQLEDVSVAGEPVEQDPADGHGVLGSGPLPGRHIPTVRQNRRSPGGLTGAYRRMPAVGLCSAVTSPRPSRCVFAL